MDTELKPNQNTGVLIRPPLAGSYIAGVESGILPVVLEPTGQWDPYLPDEESQAVFAPALVLDTSACVTFSATNNVETLLNRMLAKGELPASHVGFLKDKGYINKATGKVNFSDRFTAKMSGTTKAGNYLEKVGDSMRNDGMIPEGDWPFPNMDDLKDTYSPGNVIVSKADARWDRYYAEIPQTLKDKARLFKEFFDIKYQWVITGTSDRPKLHASLVYGPVQIAAAVCSPWSSNEGMPPIPACGCGAGHATLIYGNRPDLALASKDFDHYKSFRKLLAPDYCIPWGLQFSIGPKVAQVPTVFKYTFLVNLKAGMPNTSEVHFLQLALQTVKRPSTGQPYMKPGVFGAYGPQTKQALGLFQIDQGITDPDGPGANFGPQSRAAMNKALNN